MQRESITKQQTFMKTRVSLFRLCCTCVVAKKTEKTGEQHEMISLDKSQEARAPGNRKRLL